MKYIEECTAKFLTGTPNALMAIEAAGRTCYKTEDRIEDCSTCGRRRRWRTTEKVCPECSERSEKFVRMILNKGHEAMIEFADATFRFVCDRGVTHEDVRHRLCSFAQESTRYCNYSKDKFGSEITVIRPPGLTDEQWKYREAHFEQVEKLYNQEISMGIKPQIARGLLPISLKTEIVHKANFREWRHILRLRTGKPAHPQIRQMMTVVWNWFNDNYPVIVEDIEPYTVEQA